ncbi:MAG: hypothetical protein EA409_08025 [Saprospirales bacterium]|nr:MAG: hypothetical protein EA409_08025 [Saprospirales bacterium]
MYKITALILLIHLAKIIIVPTDLCADSFAITEIYREEITLSKNVSIVEIRSFFGDLAIVPSEGEEILMIVNLAISESVVFPMDEFREYHAIGLYEQDYKLKIDNLIANAPSMWWRTFGVSFADKNISLRIELHLPPDLKIMVDHRNGDISIRNFSGASHFNLNNSTLSGGVFTGGTTFILDHSEVEVEFVDSASIFSTHSRLFFLQSNHLEINSSHSEVVVFQCNSADIASVLDPELRFYYCGNAKVESASSNFFFHRIGGLEVLQSINDSLRVMELEKFANITSEESYVFCGLQQCAMISIDLQSVKSNYIFIMPLACGLVLELKKDEFTHLVIPDIEWESPGSNRTIIKHKNGEGLIRFSGEIKGGSFLLNLLSP